MPRAPKLRVSACVLAHARGPVPNRGDSSGETVPGPDYRIASGDTLLSIGLHEASIDSSRSRTSWGRAPARQDV